MQLTVTVIASKGNIADMRKLLAAGKPHCQFASEGEDCNDLWVSRTVNLQVMEKIVHDKDSSVG